MSEKSDVDQGMSGNDESSSGGNPFKKPRFMERWLEDPKMSTWLRKKADGRAWCAVCKIHFATSSRKCAFSKHSTSFHHKLNITKRMEEAGTSVEGAGISVERTGFNFEEVGTSVEGAGFSLEEAGTSLDGADTSLDGAGSSLDEAGSSSDGAGSSSDGAGISSKVCLSEIKEVAIKYCLFAVERNISFETLQELNTLHKCIFPKIPLMQCMKLRRTKIRSVIKNVINKCITLNIKRILEEKYYSLIIDESTDISNIKHLSILIRFINDKYLETHLLDLIGIKEATAENIFKCIINSLNKFNLSINNMVGVGVDNANVMVGSRNSLMTRFKNSNSEIVTFACLCHSMHLIAIHATECIPDFIDKLLQDIYKYFSHSPKRETLLQDIQILMHQQKQKILRPSKTRWLAQQNCIQRILKQWVPLFSLFAEENVTNNLDENGMYSSFTNDFSKPYLEFLNYILKKFNYLNALFQSKKILIHTIGEECKAFINLLAMHFIKEEFLTDGNFATLNVQDADILLPLHNMYIGEKATALINYLQETKPEINDKITEFYVNIQKFYKIAYTESINRLPFNDQFVEALNFLDPEVALDYTRHVGQIKIVVNQFPSKVIRSKVIDQWLLLGTALSEQEKDTLKALDVVEFWSTVSNLKSGDNLLYDEIGKLAFICLSLPHSNADVERCFSIITDLKNKKRSSLSTQMVCALTRIKLYLQSKQINTCSFQIPEQMLQCFNSQMYNREHIPTELNGILLADETDNSSSDTEMG